MLILVEKITNISDAHEAMVFTSRKCTDPKAPLKELYRWEHSIIRTQLFKIKMIDIPTFVSVHFVRHNATGQQHYVTSNRSDRGGEGNDKVTRNSPVNHLMILNAQHLIDMSRVRLCGKADVVTQNIMMRIKEEMARVDLDLAFCMVPNCVYRVGCNEPSPCGFWQSGRG